MTSNVEPSSWHGPGCTAVVTETAARIGSGPPLVAIRVSDQNTAEVGLPPSLVVAVSLPAPALNESVAPAGSTPSTRTDCHIAVAMDSGPPIRWPWRWQTAGDRMTAWDALRALRLGDFGTDTASGVATAFDGDDVATVPLEAAACGSSIAVPWYVWSNGRLALVVASGLDAEEPFWDIVIVQRVGLGARWSAAFRASVYIGSAADANASDDLADVDTPVRLADLIDSPTVLPVETLGAAAHPVRPVPELAASASGPPSTIAAPARSVETQAAPILDSGASTRWLPTPESARQAIDALGRAIQQSRFGGPRLPWALFWGGILVYLVTRLWGVTEYPLAFDGDEAGIVVLGRALLDNGFRDGYGIWFPIFFAYPNWNPDVGVYVHLLASSIFGVSVTVARVTAVLLSVPAPFALAAALKWGFTARGWWLAPYVLSTLPMWFHLSRSAYDSATWVAFFACAVAAYYRYRYRDPAWALQFVGASLLTFYSNAVAHLFAVLLIGAVFVIDWRYHREHWRAWRVPAGLGTIGLLPLLTFLTKNPEYLSQRLNSTHPHWGDGTKPLIETLIAQGRAAIISLNPMVWFVSENRGRFVDVTGYHNYYPGTMPLLPWWVGICVAIGLLAIWMPAFKGRRALLLSLLAMSSAPTAISRFAPTRSLAAIVPIVILSVYWADAVLPASRRVALVIGAAALIVTTTSSILTLNQALTTQSTRVQDFGGYGIQWGSKEVFALVNQRLRTTPGARVMVTTDWTWGGHHFIKFYMDRQDLVAGRVFLGSLETILKAREPWGPDLWAILSPAQLDFLRERMRISAVEGTGSRVVEASVTDSILHPDGSPGFVMVHLREATNIADILAAERAAANRPTYSDMTVDGQVVRVGTTSVDDGSVEPVLNHAPNALVRFVGPNPTVIDITYASVRPVSGIRLVLGAGMWKVTAHLSGQSAGAALDVTGTGEQDGPNSVVNLTVGGSPFQTRRIVYEILQPNATEDDSTVHLYSIEVRP